MRQTSEEPPPQTTRPQEQARRISEDAPSSQDQVPKETTREQNFTTRRSRDPTPRRNCNARPKTTDLDVLVDGRDVSALVDTGADYSVISERLATELKKVKTEWDGMQMRTAGGHLITPKGRCTARITIRDDTYPTTFVILQHCSRDVILGIDFLNEHDAVIDLKSQSITLSTDQAINHDRNAERPLPLSVIEEHVSLEPFSSTLVSVSSEALEDIEALVEGNTDLLFDRGICVARGIANFRKGRAEVLVTNFTAATRHLNKGTTVAFLEKFAEISKACVLTDSSTECVAQAPNLEHQSGAAITQTGTDQEPSLPIQGLLFIDVENRENYNH